MRTPLPSVGPQDFDVGLGTLTLAGAYGPVSEVTALAILRRAIDLGVVLIDTADAYGLGVAEEWVGRAISGHHNEVLVSTKVGLVGGGRGGVRNDREYLRSAVRASRARLKVETIDLLFLHRLDRSVPIEETVGVLAEFVEEGSVARIGLSEVTAAELERAIAVHPIAAVQSEWSVWSRDVERGVVPVCSSSGTKLVASSPLGRGFLAGRTSVFRNDDRRSTVPRLNGRNRSSNLDIAAMIARLSRAEGMTPAQLVLAWLRESGLRSGAGILPVPGARAVSHVEDNLASATRAMTPSTLRVLDSLANLVSGDRGNPEWLSFGHE